jgi:hypothetical protein
MRAAGSGSCPRCVSAAAAALPAFPGCSAAAVVVLGAPGSSDQRGSEQQSRSCSWAADMPLLISKPQLRHLAGTYNVTALGMLQCVHVSR